MYHKKKSERRVVRMFYLFVGGSSQRVVFLNRVFVVILVAEVEEHRDESRDQQERQAIEFLPYEGEGLPVSCALSTSS